MNANEYQELAARTLIDLDFELTNEQLILIRRILAIAKDFGKVVEVAKKGVFHQHGINMDQAHRQLNCLVENAFDPLGVIDNENINLICDLFGLIGEACELIELLAQEESTEEWRKELGDISWYVASLTTKKDLFLAEVMEKNIDKLKKRYPDGYNSADSIKRVDVAGDK